MSKFLQILEENDPANQSKMDAAFQAKFFLHEHEIPFSSQGSKIIFHDERGDIVLEVLGYQPKSSVEDEEVTVDDEVEGLANKANMGKIKGPNANKAKGAVTDRQRMAGQAVDVYKKGTDSLRKSIQNNRNQQMSKRNITV